MTRQQQKYIHSLIQHIADEAGYISAAYLKNQLKQGFEQAMDYDRPFSLSLECSDKEFREFLNYVLEIGLECGVLNEHPVVFIQDIEAWVAFCMSTKTCCVTGTKENVEVHFVDRYISNSYKTYIPDHYKKMPLTRHLHQLIHEIGYKEFIHQYPVVGIYTKQWPDEMDNIDGGNHDMRF